MGLRSLIFGLKCVDLSLSCRSRQINAKAKTRFADRPAVTRSASPEPGYCSSRRRIGQSECDEHEILRLVPVATTVSRPDFDYPCGPSACQLLLPTNLLPIHRIPAGCGRGWRCCDRRICSLFPVTWLPALPWQAALAPAGGRLWHGLWLPHYCSTPPDSCSMTGATAMSTRRSVRRVRSPPGWSGQTRCWLWPAPSGWPPLRWLPAPVPWLWRRPGCCSF